MFKKLLLSSCLALSSLSAWANLPYYPIQFPRDEAAHQADVPYPVGTMSEWWYYNGKLTSTNGRQFGYYLSYNRFQVDFFGNKFVVPRLEIQITDIDNKVVYGTVLMPQENETEFSTNKLHIKFNNDITLNKNQNTYEVNVSIPSKQGTQLHLNLHLTPTRDVLLINGNGIGDMWSGTNSYYYSQTHLNTSGTMAIGNEKLTIDANKSLSWMDHQWGDFIIIPGVNQWTWSSVQLENGLEINLGEVLDPQDPKAKKPLGSAASIVMPDGSHVYTRNLKVTPHPDPSYKHPLRYSIEIPDIDLQLELNSFVPGQDVNGISEGISEATGIFQGKAVKGHAYAESTIDN